jgi:hypothetical protein
MLGAEEIELPIPDAANSVHKVAKVRVDRLPSYIDATVRDALDRGDDAPAALNWVLGAAKGAAVLDAATADRLGKLSAGLASAADKTAYFQDQIKPFLSGMRPAARK